MKNRLHFISLMTVLAGFAVSCDDSGLEEKNPVIINVETTLTIGGEADTHELPYLLENAGGNIAVSATTKADWIYDLTAADGKVRFTVYDNFSAVRTATVTLSCGTDATATVEVTQTPFDFKEFSVSLTELSAKGVKATITPLSHQTNYFFEVMSKASVDRYLALDANKPGDMGFGNALYLSDKEYLTESAQKAGTSLEHYLHSLTSMYKMTETGESVEVPYNTLKSNTEYYLVVYGMSHQGERTSAINLFQFKTAALEYSDMTFTGRLADVQQNQATFAITPSNATATYYWTYVTDSDFEKYSLDFIMSNMVSSLLSDASLSGVSIETFLGVNLNKGSQVETLGGLMTNTTYHIVVWGMDLSGNTTTEAFEILEFTTKDFTVTDNCTFDVTVTTVEDMDIRVRVEPSSPDTRYYVAFIDEARCEGYNDSQMVERTINMETSRINSGYYGIGVTWETFKDMHTGTKELWGRRDLNWTFEPEKNYHIFVFGVSAKGKCTTQIKKIVQKTAEAEMSDMTFNVALKSSSWDRATFTITPDNDEDLWLPFLIPTEDLVTYRYNDGSLMEEEVMAQIKDYYEDEITSYIYRSTRDWSTKWFSEQEYSLLVFGYAGTNTTKIYEYTFTSPEIPFDKANVDVDVNFELFRGSDLKALAPDVWSDVEDGDCIMISRMTTTGNPAHWYVGLWPPVENFKDSGGRDHLVTLNMSPDSPPGDVWIDKTFYRTRPWWYGSTKDYLWTGSDGEKSVSLSHMPWSLSYFAADAQGNFGPWNYELFIPVPFPKEEVTEPYHVGYSQAYDFWSNSASDVKIFKITLNK